MLKKWQAGGQTIKLTALRYDLSGIMSRLHKVLQRSDLTLPDVIQARDSAVSAHSRIQLMADGPLPGGKEEGTAGGDVADDFSETGPSGRRKIVNTNVPSM